MKVYFVRHGETENNIQKVHNHADSQLTESGREQARIVAKRFKSIDFDVILASDYPRAKETAEIIQKETGKELIFTELARERTLPPEMQNKSHHDPSVQEIVKAMIDNVRDPNFHYSNEDNFFDMKTRSQRLVEFIAGRSENNLLVVSHGTILTYTVATMVFGPNFSWDTIVGFTENVRFDNTGITVCEFVNNKWKLITWNDSLHLGEI